MPEVAGTPVVSVVSEAPVANVVTEAPKTAVPQASVPAPEITVVSNAPSPVVGSNPESSAIAFAAPATTTIALETPVAQATPMATIAPATPVSVDAQENTAAPVVMTPDQNAAAPVANVVIETPVANTVPETQETPVARPSSTEQLASGKMQEANAVTEKGTAPAAGVALEEDDNIDEDTVIVQPQVAMPQQIQPNSAPAAAPQGVTSVSNDMNVAATARTQNLVEMVDKVCATIHASFSEIRGQGEVRIQLKPDMLDGTVVHLVASGKTMTVTFQPATSEAQRVLESNITQFEQHLAGSIHNYQIAVTVKKGKNNERV
ncbi:MAG: flagellar hook-length control protein FliK [Victivallales bacterium]|nr:flagellar hook-length control protein FliK [Victivallales bacterium]